MMSVLPAPHISTTCRLGTSAVNYSGVGMTTNVNISERPVTTQGMAGLRMTAGPGRQVQDVSYWLGQLHNRVSEVTKEVGRMEDEITKKQKDQSAYTSLSSKYDTLIDEVRRLEGQLADYNLAMDKARSGVVCVVACNSSSPAALALFTAHCTHPAASPPPAVTPRASQVSRAAQGAQRDGSCSCR